MTQGNLAQRAWVFAKSGVYTMEEMFSMFVVCVFLGSANLTPKTAIFYLYTGELSWDPYHFFSISISLFPNSQLIKIFTLPHRPCFAPFLPYLPNLLNIDSNSEPNCLKLIWSMLNLLHVLAYLMNNINNIYKYCNFSFKDIKTRIFIHLCDNFFLVTFFFNVGRNALYFSTKPTNLRET